MFSSPSFLGCPGYGDTEVVFVYGSSQLVAFWVGCLRLYAWEKKLYDEVKAGGSTQKIYKRKCSQLRNKDMRREVNWCSKCKRKLGLIGFRYRCGKMFCSNHRYSDRHECRFDYKAAGRAMIAKENPVVKPARILKV
ncbi:Zinc finger A20 and AN1 domain-containing stress-associated protein 5 [Vitis vinifera]|uniref:Zinc finger A20 and AN1 domain-containing stress-associated protein 5 n=2 Tax=Vitis vinifera TaxID=29760 RepID=A0A438BSM5_VITVI|nr:Zinc finger A20 and AN1 domain-containing stress-associated protein 5 [Vitis vinifera]